MITNERMFILGPLTDEFEIRELKWKKQLKFFVYSLVVHLESQNLWPIKI